MANVLFSSCPICASNELKKVFDIKDHSVSGELFTIMECQNCSLRFTSDAPAQNLIGPYYKSEDYISHTNTSKGLVNGLYQVVRKFTLQQKRKLIQRFTGHLAGSILDLGSGTGAFVATMKTAGWQVMGLEPDADARKIAYDTFGVNLTDLSSFYQLQKSSYDAITMWHVLEHVHSLHEYMAQLKNLLKQDGRLFIAVPNYTSGEAQVYKTDWAAYDVPRHLYHFSPASMQKLVSLHGLKIYSYQPMWFDSFYISLLSSKYKNGKSNLIGAGIQGLLSNLKAMSNPKLCSSVIYVIGE